MYNKLVRDNIPEIIRANGEEPIVQILNDQEYKAELEIKLLEECNEVLSAKGINRLEELADLMEVLISLANLENKTLEDIEKIRIDKKSKRGGFTKKLYLKGVR